MPVDYTYKNIVPYAVSNYEEIRECGYYYVDKTMFIPMVEKYKAPVFLRPRRFVEFKYFKPGDEKKIKSKRTPYKEDVEQVRDYSRWVHRQFPDFSVCLYVCYVCANKVIKVWDVSERRIE